MVGAGCLLFSFGLLASTPEFWGHARHFQTITSIWSGINTSISWFFIYLFNWFYNFFLYSVFALWISSSFIYYFNTALLLTSWIDCIDYNWILDILWPSIELSEKGKLPSLIYLSIEGLLYYLTRIISWCANFPPYFSHKCRNYYFVLRGSSDFR